MTKYFDKKEYENAINDLLGAITKMEEQKLLLEKAVISDPQWAVEAGYLTINYRISPMQRLAKRHAKEELSQ